MNKLNIAVFFGGKSSEHEVSCMSAANVIPCIDETRYQVVLVGITKEGRWLLVENTEDIKSGKWTESTKDAMLSPDATKKALYVFENGTYRTIPVDVIFPVLHGLNGEDGTIQGVFEMAQIPYVGCGVLASAVSMDKLYTKLIVDTLGIRQAAYVAVNKKELTAMDSVIVKIEAKLSYPVFVKPSRAGSSKGVSKATDRESLVTALVVAAENDSKILVEETIVGRELECAVLGGKEVKASGVGEVLAAAEFYDYEAKYFNEESRTDITPVLPEGVEEEIREDAVKIFCAVDGRSLSRVDFFLDAKGVVFNEINTLPGFTSISMYPMLWNHKGLDRKELIQTLIDTAFTRNED